VSDLATGEIVKKVLSHERKEDIRPPSRRSNLRIFGGLLIRTSHSNSFPVNNTIDYCLLVVYDASCSCSKLVLPSLFSLVRLLTAIPI
jgi:hypothetical protein